MKSVTVFLNDQLRSTVTTASHQFFADEPVPAGEDAGPDPYDLLLGSLGACTAMTLRLYANHKKWPVESIHVTLSHDRTHLKDCEDCEGDHQGNFVDHIQRVIDIRGEVTPEQKTRLLEIADRCPVARSLKNKPRIQASLAEGP